MIAGLLILLSAPARDSHARVSGAKTGESSPSSSAECITDHKPGFFERLFGGRKDSGNGGGSGHLLTGHQVYPATPPPGSALNAKGTFFGNRDDPYMDGKPKRGQKGHGTWVGQGAYGKLVPGVSIGMTPMLKRRIRARGGDRIAWRYSDGTIAHGRLDDIGTDKYKGKNLGFRVDVYARNQTEAQLNRNKYGGAHITHVWVER